MGRKAVSRLFYYISIVLSCLLAGVTLAGNASGHIPPTQNITLAFIGLAMPVLLLLNLGMMVYWIIRLRIWFLIPLFGIIGNWNYLARVIQFNSAKTSEKQITIGTYNVDGFNRDLTGYTCKEIARYMEKQQADIVCMQEFDSIREFTVDSIKAAFSAWPYVAIPHPKDTTNILQIAIFSKYPILDTQLVTYPDSKNCSMWCDLDIDGKNIRVFNNHLQTTEVSSNKRRLEKELGKDNAERTEYAAFKLVEGLGENFIKRTTQAEHIQKLIATSPYPTLVCGDFNSLPSSYTYRTIKGNKLNDGFQTAGHGYMYTFRYFKHLLRIDYIFHSEEWKGLDYYSENLDYSDHNPVIMKLQFIP